MPRDEPVRGPQSEQSEPTEPRQLHALRRGLARRRLVAGLWRGLQLRRMAAAVGLRDRDEPGDVREGAQHRKESHRDGRNAVTTKAPALALQISL